MIYSRQYSRQLIVLKNITSTKASGRCVIEIKNSQARLIVNTYTLPSNSPYNICFVLKNSGHRAFKIGEAVSGGQRIIPFNPDDIYNNKIEDIAAVAVVGSDSNIPVLAGFTGDFTDLRSGISIYNESKNMTAASVKKTVPDKINVTQSSNSKSRPTEALAQNTDLPKENSKKSPIDFLEMFDKFRRDMEELERMAFSPDNSNNEQVHKTKAQVPDTKETSDIVLETIKGENEGEITIIPERENKLKQISPAISDYVSYIEATKESAADFINDTDKINWYKISPDELAAIEEVPIKIATHPFCTAAYKKYGCILLGICHNSNRKYIIGIPSSNDNVSPNSPFRQVIPSSDSSLSCHLFTI